MWACGRVKCTLHSLHCTSTLRLGSRLLTPRQSAIWLVTHHPSPITPVFPHIDISCACGQGPGVLPPPALTVRYTCPEYTSRYVPRSIPLEGTVWTPRSPLPPHPTLLPAGCSFLCGTLHVPLPSCTLYPLPHGNFGIRPLDGLALFPGAQNQPIRTSSFADVKPLNAYSLVQLFLWLSLCVALRCVAPSLGLLGCSLLVLEAFRLLHPFTSASTFYPALFLSHLLLSHAHALIPSRARPDCRTHPSTPSPTSPSPARPRSITARGRRTSQIRNPHLDTPIFALTKALLPSPPGRSSIESGPRQLVVRLEAPLSLGTSTRLARDLEARRLFLGAAQGPSLPFWVSLHEVAYRLPPTYTPSSPHTSARLYLPSTKHLLAAKLNFARVKSSDRSLNFSPIAASGSEQTLRQPLAVPAEKQIWTPGRGASHPPTRF